MAGDWIKMRADLLTHPKVVRMMSALKADKFRIVGGLMSVWCLFDAHSEDGRLSGYTPELLDTMAAWDGFSGAMVAVDWLHIGENDGLQLPRFDVHNGQSAKRRAQDADRKRADRKSSAYEADKKRTRGEKRREEKKDQKLSADAVGFDDFWNAYPNKTGKKPAQAKWDAKCLDDIADKLIADVKERIASDRKWREGYIPNPATYLTQERWNDEIQTAGVGSDEDWRKFAV